MTLGTIGAVLAALVVIFIIAHAWFHIVEGVLGGVKRLFGKKETGAWHTLPPEREQREKARD